MGLHRLLEVRGSFCRRWDASRECIRCFPKFEQNAGPFRVPFRGAYLNTPASRTGALPSCQAEMSIHISVGEVFCYKL